MRTTLTLDEDVAAKLKTEARRRGRSFKQTVNEVLRSGLAQQSRTKKQKPFKIHAKNMGLRPGLNYDCASRLLEEVEGPTYRSSCPMSIFSSLCTTGMLISMRPQSAG